MCPGSMGYALIELDAAPHKGILFILSILFNTALPCLRVFV